MGKFYITTAIDYVNDKPHLGHALEKIQADVLARYHRLAGDEVFFLTGTDEHGAKIVRAARAAGKEPGDFTGEISEKFRGLGEALNLSWREPGHGDFIRTSDKERHWPGAEKMWKALREAGALYEQNYKGLYCVGHEAFITEKELVDGKCPDHGKEPEMVEEKNWFFKLSKYAKEVAEKIKSGEFQIIPEGRRNEILSFLEGEVNDVSFSRSKKNLEWGIPVPDNPEQVMYVWCDALTSYISAIGYGQPPTSNLQRQTLEHWWPADVQVIGKDILRFHAAIWPAMLTAAKLPLPKQLFVHGFITVDGKKMSKTIGNVVDPVEFIDKLVAKGVPRESAIDAFRYYLLREIPSTEDGDFSEEKFIERYNADLANGLGNLVARVIAVAEKRGNFDIGGIGVKNEGIQISKEKYKRGDKSFQATWKHDVLAKDLSSEIEFLERYVKSKIDEFEFNDALEKTWFVMKLADSYVGDSEIWEGNKSREIATLLLVLDNFGRIIEPFLPVTAKKIRNSIHRDGSYVSAKKIENLFPRIS